MAAILHAFRKHRGGLQFCYLAQARPCQRLQSRKHHIRLVLAYHSEVRYSCVPAPRIQFLAMEIARSREGYNKNVSAPPRGRFRILKVLNNEQRVLKTKYSVCGFVLCAVQWRLTGARHASLCDIAL